MSRSLTGTQSKSSWHGPSGAVAHVIMFHACPDVCLHVVAFRPAVSGSLLPCHYHCRRHVLLNYGTTMWTWRLRC